MVGAEAATPVFTERRGPVLLVRLDDGKANALSPGSIRAIEDALDQVHTDRTGVRGVCVVGRPGTFCAGYDLAVLGAGADAGRALVRAGQELSRRLYTVDVPTAAVVTGHALGAGAALALACDVRIGVAGPWRIGFPETSRGMAVSTSTLELARARLRSDHLSRALLESRMYGPHDAVEPGFLDEVLPADDAEEAALERLARLATYRRFGRNKRALQEAQADVAHG